MTIPKVVRAVGVDFDNTIAGYDELMHALARERGLIGDAVPRNKKAIRDTVRALPDGETHWRGLQATAYGSRMQDATPIPGARAFFRECKRQGVPVYIVSHKTEFSNLTENGVNLREAASAWLEREGFVGDGDGGIDAGAVFFEGTRAEKIARIAALGVSHFVDDLEETFLEPAFPPAVDRLLLCTSAQRAPAGVTACAGWMAVYGQVFGAPSPSDLHAMLGHEIRSLERCRIGGNSRVYRATLDDGTSLALKSYLQPTMDGLDRLSVEFGALSFLWNQGERAVPQPIASAPAQRVAAYEFVEGEPIDASRAGKAEIEQVIDFVNRLHGLRTHPDAASLPRASESCESFAALETNLQQRVRRLQSPGDTGEDSAMLAQFLTHEFVPALDLAIGRAKRSTGAAGWTRAWSNESRTLSPSDMGFHNALRRPDGSLAFLDFEYFGWDDAAKMLSDFVLHPAMSLTAEAKRLFAARVLDVFSSDHTLPERFATAYPLFALKWCLILLNEFVPSDLARRQFASADRPDHHERRMTQLKKSRALLERTMVELEQFPFAAVRA
jgi:hypothetical protein